MADIGFTIRDVLEKKKCKLNIPPFRGACAQFTTDEVFETQEIASLRIHVERSIGKVHNGRKSLCIYIMTDIHVLNSPKEHQNLSTSI
jgi:hypothetical protein